MKIQSRIKRVDELMTIMPELPKSLQMQNIQTLQGAQTQQTEIRAIEFFIKNNEITPPQILHALMSIRKSKIPTIFKYDIHYLCMEGDVILSIFSILFIQMLYWLYKKTIPHNSIVSYYYRE